MVDGQKREDKVRLAEACALAVYSNEDFGGVLFRRLVCRCRFADVDSRKTIVSNRIRAVEVMFNSLFVLLVWDAALIPQRLHQIAADLRS